MNFKKFYKPKSEFKERNRAVFLSAYKTKFPTSSQNTPAFRYFIRGAAFGAAMVIVLTAGATYADQKNVGVSSVLYPLKKTSEAVKVAFTSGSAKEELHLELAERRFAEIKEVSENNPENPQIETLSKELEKEIQKSILKVELTKIPAAVVQVNSVEDASKPRAPKTAPVPSAGISAGSAQIFSTEIRKTEIEENESNEDSEEKRDSEKNGLESTRGEKTLIKINRRQSNACDLMKKIVTDEDSRFSSLKERNPEILEKFKENCEAIFDSEVEIEIED